MDTSIAAGLMIVACICAVCLLVAFDDHRD
jgi:hypothetical protein